MRTSAHAYEIDVEKRLAVITYHGPVSAAGALDTMRRVASDPAWNPEFGRMMIYDDGEYGDIDPVDMKALAAGLVELRKARKSQATPRTAHVCADPIKRTVVLHWLAAIATMETTVNELFHSRRQAEAWFAEPQADA